MGAGSIVGMNGGSRIAGELQFQSIEPSPGQA
jgi:hypothetical protein